MESDGFFKKKDLRSTSIVIKMKQITGLFEDSDSHEKDDVDEHDDYFPLYWP